MIEKKLKFRIVQSTQWDAHYDSGKVVTSLSVNGCEVYEDKREFGKEHGAFDTVEQDAADEVTNLLATALGNMMRQCAEKTER